MSKQPRKFEYALAKLNHFEMASAVEDDLNNWGEEGWELCGIEYGSFILKRERHGEE